MAINSYNAFQGYYPQMPAPSTYTNAATQNPFQTAPPLGNTGMDIFASSSYQPTQQMSAQSPEQMMSAMSAMMANIMKMFQLIPMMLQKLGNGANMDPSMINGIPGNNSSECSPDPNCDNKQDESCKDSCANDPCEDQLQPSTEQPGTKPDASDMPKPEPAPANHEPMPEETGGMEAPAPTPEPEPIDKPEPDKKPGNETEETQAPAPESEKLPVVATVAPIDTADVYHISGWGQFNSIREGNRPHQGIDIYPKTPDGKEGTKPNRGINVKTPISGEVVEVKTDPNDSTASGNYVKIKGDDGKFYRFSHLAQAGDFPNPIALPEVGKKLNAGDVLGYIGQSGTTNVWHLHFEVSTEAEKAKQMADPAWQELEKNNVTRLDGQIDPLDKAVAGPIADLLRQYTIVPKSDEFHLH